MSDVSIGNISTSVIVDISAVQANTDSAAKSVQAMAQAIQVSVGNITQNIRVMGDGLAAQQLRMQAALNQITGTFGSMGGTIGAALQNAVKAGADLDSALLTIANNTSMTADEVGVMTETVKRLGKETGAPFKQLAEGFRNIVDYGFKAKDAPKMLEAAMKAALATGADVGKVAGTLAGTMHTFGMSVEQSAGAMNVLKVAAQDGHMTLEQFSSAAGPTLAMAGSMGASFTMTAAAFVSLTRHMFSASEAGTQIKNVLVHMAEPGQQVRGMLEDLSKKSGIDLVHAFTIAAQSGKGMDETMDKIKATAAKLGVNADDLMMKLIKAMRGGLGAMVLAKTGASDFKEEMAKLDAVMGGKLDPTTAQFEQQQQTLNAQIAKGRNETQLLSLSIEHALQPALIASMQKIHSLIEGFLHLSEGQQKGIVTTAALVSGFLLAVRTISQVIATVNALSTACATLGIVSAGLVVAGLLAAAAAAGLLYVAYNKLTESTAKSTQDMIEDARANQKAAEDKAKHSEEVMTLVDRYEKLKSQSKRTKDQEQELHDILDKIGQLNPSLVTGFNNQGHALDAVTDLVRRATDAFYEMHHAAALAASSSFAALAMSKAEQRDKLNEELSRKRALLQSGSVMAEGVRPASDAERNSPLVIRTARMAPFGLGGDTNYSMPNLQPATLEQRAKLAGEAVKIEKDLAGLEQERLGYLKQMKEAQAPYAPGHQGDNPGAAMWAKRAADKQAEIDNLKAQRDKAAHDAGLPNYNPPKKEKKGKKDKEDDEDFGEKIVDALDKPVHLDKLDATCANFVKKILQRVGLAFATSDSAHVLIDQLVKNGAEKVTGDLKKGDILYFTGGKYGNNPGAPEKDRHHVGIYEGDGLYSDSPHAGVVQRHKPLTAYAMAHLQGYRIGDKEDRANNLYSTAQDTAKDQAEKLKEAQDKIFELTHNGYDVQRREADKQRDEAVQNGVPKATADKERALTLKKIDAEQAKDALEKLGEATQSLASGDAMLTKQAQEQDKAQEEAVKSYGKMLQGMGEGDALFTEEVDKSEKERVKKTEEAKKEAEHISEAFLDRRMEGLDSMNQFELDATLRLIEALQSHWGQYTDQWLSYQKKRETVSGKKQELADAPINAARAKMQTFLLSMRQNVEGILGGAFQKLFEGDSKHWFSDMLKSFVQMLEQMMAKALALGIINLLTGGAGGFLGGAGAKGKGNGGFLSVFGFDDATNDHKAANWGFDFGRHFTGGIQAYNNAHKPFAAAGAGGAGGGDTHIHLNMPGMVIREHADIGKIADALATRVQSGLSGRFVGTGR